MTSRKEGYRRGRPKEQGGIDLVMLCCREVLGLDPDPIESAEENRLCGDLRVHGSAEVKRQPIDPCRYRRNYVEVLEDTSAGRRAYHRDGLSVTASILSLSVGEFADCEYTDRRCLGRSGPYRLGHLEYVSASMRSMAGSSLTIYANPENGFVFFYSRSFLLGTVRNEVLQGSLTRGMGQANDDTFGVLVPNSNARWQQTDDAWVFRGSGSAPVDRIRKMFSEEP